MRLVIDSNQLQSNKLKTFLSKSSKNRAILPDFTAMEAYKGDTLNSIFKSMSVLSDFPEQVTILKGSAKICNMNGRTKGLARRLIDDIQTNDFIQFVPKLRQAETGHKYYREELIKLGRYASEHLNTMLDDARQMGKVFEILGNEYSKEERAILREQKAYTSAMVDRLARTIFFIAKTVFNSSSATRKTPRYNELSNTFIFRFTLSCYVMAITRSAQGGVLNIRPEKLRNDLVDMILVAYGTYFDGIMSNDKNVNLMFTETCLLLKGLFDAEVPSMERLLRKHP